MSDVTSVLTEIRQKIAEIKPDTARIDARQIMMHACQLTPEALITERTRAISEDEKDLINQMVNRRLSGEPVTKIVGTREFWGMNFATNRATLDPRPDSETLISNICDFWQGRINDPLRILDLGTGSGCLLLSLLSEFKNAKGVGIDQSTEAAETAIKNAAKLGLKERTEIVNRSWDGYVADQKFDLIISNPPYIRTSVIDDLEEEVRHYDPMSALDGGHDGLDCYRDLYQVIDQNLATDGMLVFEIGYDQNEDVSGLYSDDVFYVKDVWKDIAEQDRAIQILRQKNAFF